MTQKEFIEFLQKLLALVDVRNDCSIALAKNALQAMVTLALDTRKVDKTTETMMKSAVDDFDNLLQNREQFISGQ